MTREPMTREDAHQAVVEAIVAIAPDADPTAIEGTADVMEELELDSIDLVSIVARIHDRTGVEIPERDYRLIETLDGFVDYVTRAAGELER